MTGVLLVNMGGASSPKELKVFLARMFKDPFILPFGKFGRKVLSIVISNTRYRKSWKKYQLIGGSPIVDATKKTMTALQQNIGKNYQVKIAFSYSNPFIKDSIDSFIQEGIKDITIIPLYPQSSFSTTSSVEKEVREALSNKQSVNINFVKEFYKQEAFINFWSKLISNHIKKNNYTHPYLLFSAHSIPTYLVEKGDAYPRAVEESAKAIAEKLGLEYEVAYQSGMKRSKWIGPDTIERLSILAKRNKKEITIIPISFVNENLETLYDIDQVIIPFGEKELGISHISRVTIPVADENFIELLKNIIHQSNNKTIEHE